MLQISLNRLICSTVMVFATNKYRKGCKRLNTTHPTSFRSHPLLSDYQPTSASRICWIGYGWKNTRSSSSVRHSRSCLSDLWDSQSNANPITVQCKVGNWQHHSLTADNRPTWLTHTAVAAVYGRVVTLASNHEKRWYYYSNRNRTV